MVFPFREKVALLVPKSGVARVGKKGLFASPVALLVVSRGRRGKKEVPSSKSSLFPRRETLKKDFLVSQQTAKEKQRSPGPDSLKHEQMFELIKYIQHEKNATTTAPCRLFLLVY